MTEINNYLEQEPRYVFDGMVRTDKSGTEDDLLELVGKKISEEGYVRSLHIHPSLEDDKVYNFQLLIVTTTENDPDWYIKSLEASMKKIKQVKKYLFSRRVAEENE